MSSTNKDPRQVFIFNTDWDYFKNVTQDQGGPVLQYVRDETGGLLKEWRPGDMALVWINQKHKVAAFYTIKSITEREDQVATIEWFDEASFRPHRVTLNNDPTTATDLDLRRKSYSVYYLNSNKKVPLEVLSAPLDAPLRVRLRWVLWKYAVQGEDIHFVSGGFEIKNNGTDNWYRRVVGAERDHLLEQIDAVVWGGRVKGKKRIYDEIESNKKQPQSTPNPKGSSSKPSPKAPKAPKSPKSPKSLPTTPSVNMAPAITGQLKRITIGQGTNIAVRADLPQDGFMIAQVTEQTVISDIGTEDADATEIPIRWFVEGRETSLRGFYCFPNWFATVQYGALIHVGVQVTYEQSMDMYKIEQDYDMLLAMC